MISKDNINHWYDDDYEKNEYTKLMDALFSVLIEKKHRQLLLNLVD